MKKFINVLAVMLALVMCLGIVVACASDDNEGSDDTTTVAGTTGGKQTTAGTTTAKDTTTAEVTTNIKDTLVQDPTVAVPADGVIKSAAELHAVLVSGAADGNYTVQATTLDMSPYYWEGMKNFTGTFDFNGCTVTNVRFPMFTSVIGGTVKNLKLADSTMKYLNIDSKEDKDLVPISDGDTQCRVYGGVIRYMNNGTISNVVIESTVSIYTEIWLDDSYTGGIVAYAKGTEIRVENCTFNGTIETDSTKIFIGGIAGCIEGTDKAAHNADDPKASTVLAINCVNNGTVTSKGEGADSKVAGVVGAFGSGAVYKCANYGAVNGRDKGQVAGVIGHTLNELTYMYCLNTGTITGGTGYTAGVVGYSNGDVRNFIGCVNIGTIQNSENLSTQRIGGIMGWSRKNEKFTNCYNLKSAHENWAVGNANAPIDPADPNTHKSEGGSPVVTDCANLDSIDAIFTAIDAVAPGVFAKTAEGSLTLVLG